MTILTSVTAHGLACGSGAFVMPCGNLSCEVHIWFGSGPFELVSPYPAPGNVAA